MAFWPPRALLHLSSSTATGHDEQDRCGYCAGLLDAIGEHGCCCWALPPAANPLLGERFIDRDGRETWCTPDGLYLLSADEDRHAPVALFRGPQGQRLRLRRNPWVWPPENVEAAG